MKRPQEMTIGQLAGQAGVTRRTIRYYVAEGLLPPGRGVGQRKIYGHEHLLRLKLITQMKQEYLPLHEIRKRIADLSLSEMEKLVGKETRKAESRGRSMIRESRPRYGMVRTEDHEPYVVKSKKGKTSPAVSPVESAWRRVMLAPGIELNYQITNDPQRDVAIEKIISDAMNILRS